MLFGRFRSSIYLFKANSAYQKGNTQEAINLLEKAYKTESAKAVVVTTYGYLLLKEGHLDESLKIFKEQLNSTSKISDNDLYSLKANYALALWKNGELDRAIAIYEEIFPNYKSTNVYGSLGYLYILKGNVEKALEFNLEAMEYNNTGAVILDNLGQTYYMMGEYTKAEEIFKKLMALGPKFPEAYYDYALVLEKLGEKESCIENLKTALNYKPNFLSGVTVEQIQEKLNQVEAQ
ncbi:tetratricopeptide repeat protein [Ruminiclostridium cellulolyticum]|uniref:Tetratricopeptide TPR_2 repeat protein n=1 Tax=Ruminiclostridium cellulolyticum (strain ATCC 35319 / DSM 5812 / JCM 6584 / H10) TaxID=394503 RepID=B8I0U3_RUMCH|nr:tetratricopeptide repeat protein [Ruminiclostridium cellulolyticum]ACL77499.1 Tetratricopeptide TPR_2 repeat protein [Ruminiclostridium cellulolyticum H10]